MKAVIAIDSLKGSLTSMEAGTAIKEGILKAKPDAEVIIKPLADGGEGTTDALICGLNGRKVELTARGPLGVPVSCYYGYLPELETAVMEMASAAGITLISEKNPLKASTYGVGEMILHALEQGYRRFILGIGGSATNDGGLGMLKALGYQFFDADGTEVWEGAAALGKITTISDAGVNPLLKECRFQIACDVNNPLCGSNGATYIYGPQKGVTDEMLESVDRDMASYASVTAAFTGKDESLTAGAGAAGGLGFALLSYLNAELVPGIELILNAVALEEAVQDADVVVTGEGRMDHQTAMGKAPVGVAKIGKKHGAKVIAFAGSVTPGASACNQAGIDAFFPIIRGITTLEEAMKPENAAQNLTAAAEQVFRLL